jgi:hypothetical protein
LDDDRKNLDEPVSAARPASPLILPDSPPPPRDGRRALLTGGGIAAGALFVTLASRPALASASCTISGMTSGVVSGRTAPSVGGCGSPPNCWATRTADWKGYFGSSSFKSTFMSGVATAMTYSGTDSFTACLAGSSTPKLVVTFGSSVTNNTSVLSQSVAAVLNAALFGSDNVANAHDYYSHGSASSVIATINGYLKAASQGRASVGGSVGGSNSSKASNASTCLSSLATLLTGWNTQGGSSC